MPVSGSCHQIVQNDFGCHNIHGLRSHDIELEPDALNSRFASKRRLGPRGDVHNAVLNSLGLARERISAMNHDVRRDAISHYPENAIRSDSKGLSLIWNRPRLGEVLLYPLVEVAVRRLATVLYQGGFVFEEAIQTETPPALTGIQTITTDGFHKLRLARKLTHNARDNCDVLVLESEFMRRQRSDGTRNAGFSGACCPG
jgi:hypothetical protein